MHPNPAFRKSSDATNLEFAAKRAFGTLAINADPAPLLAHMPFILGQSDRQVDLHLMRSNPIVALLNSPHPAVLSVVGPDSYISPDWYDVPDQVPTWNYVSVHLRGELSLLPQPELPGILDRLAILFESQLAPKPNWSADKMTAPVLRKMMRMIVPLRLHIGEIRGTWKLSQNKPNAARHLAASAVANHGIGHQLQALSALMQNPPTA